MCLAERVRVSDKPLIRVRDALGCNIDVTVTTSIYTSFCDRGVTENRRG